MTIETGGIRVRLVIGGLAITAGAWSIFSGLFPAMGTLLTVGGGTTSQPVPGEFSVLLGVIVLASAVVVTGRDVGSSPWPGALMLVFGVLMTLSGIVMINWIFASTSFISVAQQDPQAFAQAIAQSGLTPLFGVAMLVSGSFLLLRGTQTNLIKTVSGSPGFFGGIIPLASGFMCGGVGISAIMFVIPNSCCGGSLPGGPVFLIQSGPIPSLFMTGLGTAGLSLGVVTIVNRFFRLPLRNELWCGPVMMIIGAGMAGVGGILSNWVFNRFDWWFFSKVAGIDGLLSLAAMFGLGSTMFFLGFRSWRSRKEQCKRK